MVLLQGYDYDFRKVISNDYNSSWFVMITLMITQKAMTTITITIVIVIEPCSLSVTL